MPTPEEIQAAKEADAAKKKAAADEAARKAAAAQDADDDEGDDDDGDETHDDSDDLGELSAKQKAYIEKLRKENAKTRVKAKNLEGQYNALNDRFGKLEGGLKKLFGEGEDDLPPEKKVERLSQQNEALALSMALREAAIEHEVGKKDYEYFEFLVQKKMQALEDGEELSDEDLQAIAKQAKSKSAMRSTSVEGDDDEHEIDDSDDEVSLEDFQEMGIVAKSKLYQENRALYDKLSKDAKRAKSKK